MLEAVRQRLGTIHGLVNNAAGNFICPTERLSYNAFNSVVDIVLKGTYNCTLAIGKRWIAEGTPRAVLEHQHHVCLDRLGLRRAFGRGQGRRADHGPLAGQRVGQIRHSPECDRPRFVSHRRRLVAVAAARAGRRRSDEREFRWAAYGEHQELANLAAYLLSDFSAYITGDCITIDGGAWLRGAGSSTTWNASARHSGTSCRP